MLSPSLAKDTTEPFLFEIAKSKSLLRMLWGSSATGIRLIRALNAKRTKPRSLETTCVPYGIRGAVRALTSLFDRYRAFEPPSELNK